MEKSIFERNLVNVKPGSQYSQIFGDYIKIWGEKVLNNYDSFFELIGKKDEELSFENKYIQTKVNNRNVLYDIYEHLVINKPKFKWYSLRIQNNNVNFEKSVKDFNGQFKVFIEKFIKQPDTDSCYVNHTRDTNLEEELSYIIVKQKYVAYISYYVYKKGELYYICMNLTYMPYKKKFNFGVINEYFEDIYQENWEAIGSKNKLSLTEIINKVNAYVPTGSSSTRSSPARSSSSRSSSAKSSSTRSSSAKSSSGRSSSGRSSSARSSSTRSSSAKSSSGRSSSGRSSSAKSSSGRSSSAKSSPKAR